MSYILFSMPIFGLCAELLGLATEVGGLSQEL